MRVTAEKPAHSFAAEHCRIDQSLRVHSRICDPTLSGGNGDQEGPDLPAPSPRVDPHPCVNTAVTDQISAEVGVREPPEDLHPVRLEVKAGVS